MTTKAVLLDFVYLLEQGLGTDPDAPIDIKLLIAHMGKEERTAFRRLKEIRGVLRWFRDQGVHLNLVHTEPMKKPVAPKSKKRTPAKKAAKKSKKK
jgi:site-specific recombinase XerC